ncbi:hypothetical protein PT276_00815 [Orbaceae bacterium ESL0721]|nr:hypothetical protein [Orbaceae bacterium ESL0721]
MKVIYEIYGGFIVNNNEPVHLSTIKNPSTDEMMDYLLHFQNCDGKLVLSNTQEGNLKPNNMTLYSDNKRYLILLETVMDDGDIDVRTFNDRSGNREFILMLGEPFAIAATVDDFSLVIKAFREFLQTGDVCRELLN